MQKAALIVIIKVAKHVIRATPSYSPIKKCNFLAILTKLGRNLIAGATSCPSLNYDGGESLLKQWYH